MKPIGLKYVIATLTALVTLVLIATLFVLPLTSSNTVTPQTGTKIKMANTSTTKMSSGDTGRSGKAGVTPVSTPGTTMSLDHLGTIITRLDTGVEHPRKGLWHFTIAGASVVVVGDDEHDRLRIVVGIKSSKDLTQSELKKLTRSNFDTALDARYAISQDILWAIYVHPLKSLGARQFIAAIGQTVNLAVSYGGGYSSGGILFDGGDTKDTQRHQMIKNLIKKGLG